MLLNLTTYSNTVLATIQLLKKLQVKVTNKTISSELEKHPDYPSLLSINDTLPQYNVKTLAIDADKKHIADFPVPFLAYLSIKGGIFVTVTAIKNNILCYYDSSNKQKMVTTSIKDFEEIWTGKTLLVEAQADAGDSKYVQQKRKEFIQSSKIPILFVILMILGIIMSCFAFANTSILIAISYSFLAFFHFTGIIVSSLLLWYEIDQSNSTLKRICSSGGKTNCSAILNSKYAKFLGWLSWSEIGFYYFSGSYLGLLIIGLEAMPVLAILNFIALPYIAFSLYYQWRVAKQWCTLCLFVQSLLLLQGITNSFSFHFTGIFTVNIVSQFVIAFIIPVAIWLLLKPSLLKNRDLEPKSKELTRLKANPTIFESLLVKQKQIIQNPEGLGIILGNPNATNKIIKVCNPYCGPCSKAHPILEEILHDNPNVQVQVLFTATTEADDERNKPVRHLLALQQIYGQEMVRNAMDDWYSSEIKDYVTFAHKYPLETDILDQQNQKITKMEKWCEAVDIEFTPTLFFNGFQIPGTYQLRDIKYFLI